jgi:hypothetical protein
MGKFGYGAAALGLALSLAACGGGGSNKAADTTSTTIDAQAANLTPDQQAALQKYDDCLRQNGVDDATINSLGTGGFRGGFGPNGSGPNGSAPADSFNGTRGTGSRASGGSRPTNGSVGNRGTVDPVLQQARTACQSLLPQGIGGNRNPQQVATAIAPYLSCLSDNGVIVPTTTTLAPGATEPAGSRGGFGGGGLAGLDRNQPAFAAADAKCSVLLPAGFGNNAPASSSPTTSR